MARIHQSGSLAHPFRSIAEEHVVCKPKLLFPAGLSRSHYTETLLPWKMHEEMLTAESSVAQMDSMANQTLQPQ
jgi:hypothetical protein